MEVFSVNKTAKFTSPENVKGASVRSLYYLQGEQQTTPSTLRDAHRKYDIFGIGIGLGWVRGSIVSDVH